MCKEDRGGGLYGKDIQGRWFLRGVVSNSDWGSSNCINQSVFVSFTNLMSDLVKSWLQDTMSK